MTRNMALDAGPPTHGQAGEEDRDIILAPSEWLPTSRTRLLRV